MGRWKHVASAAVGGAAVVAVWAVVALSAPAQNPTAPPATLTWNVPEPPAAKKPDELPPLTNFDENVEQAQYQQRQPGGVAGGPPRPPANVADPPHPVVAIRVRVPADLAPGDDVKYTITVQNLSAADAHAVTVRNPLSADAKFVKAEPTPDKTSTDKQVVWSFGTLKAGKSQSIELTLNHKEGVAELKNLAYVKFEYGQSVTTKIGRPTVKVSKSAPKEAVKDETFTVRLLVENQGKVPAENVRVLENVPPSAQVEPVTAGAKRVTLPEGQQGQQWEWIVPRLQPGERKVFEYRITAREVKSDLFTLTSVSGPRVVPDKPAEARTKVLVPGLEVKLSGPSGAGTVNPGESAKYEIVVRNTGSMPSLNLKVTGTIPADCKPTLKTDGGQVFRDSVVWTVPRLEPGEALSFRYGIKASTTGRRVVRASATDARGTRHSDELATTFQGMAALVWETTFDAPTVRVGQQGVFTVRVKNVGGEGAKDVRLQLDVPDNVSVVQTTPKARVENNVLQFEAEAVKGYGELTYTITFEGKKADQAWFRARLAADCLGDRPMQTEKAVAVIGGPK